MAARRATMRRWRRFELAGALALALFLLLRRQPEVTTRVDTRLDTPPTLRGTLHIQHEPQRPDEPFYSVPPPSPTRLPPSRVKVLLPPTPATTSAVFWNINTAHDDETLSRMRRAIVDKANHYGASRQKYLLMHMA